VTYLPVEDYTRVLTGADLPEPLAIRALPALAGT
jgi:hypothetical protein